MTPGYHHMLTLWRNVLRTVLCDYRKEWLRAGARRDAVLADMRRYFASADGREVCALALLTVTADDMARMVAQVTAPADTSALDNKWARSRHVSALMRAEVRGC